MGKQLLGFPFPITLFSAAMGALTPVRPGGNRPFAEQVSLVHLARPSLHSVTNHLIRPATAFLLPAQLDGLPRALTFTSSVIQSASRSELHRSAAGSPLRPAESCSLRTAGSPLVAPHLAPYGASHNRLPAADSWSWCSCRTGCASPPAAQGSASH
jgi:hypothetical protein